MGRKKNMENENKQLSILNGSIQIGEQQNFHVSHLEVFTGDDDYNETSCYRVDADPNSTLTISNRVEPKIQKVPYRLRNEPGVRIFLKSEWGDDFVLQVCHHKGSILVDLV